MIETDPSHTVSNLFRLFSHSFLLTQVCEVTTRQLHIFPDSALHCIYRYNYTSQPAHQVASTTSLHLCESIKAQPHTNFNSPSTYQPRLPFVLVSSYNTHFNCLIYKYPPHVRAIAALHLAPIPFLSQRGKDTVARQQRPTVWRRIAKERASSYGLA